MKNNLEKHLIKNSQLLQASLTLQWAFAILGLNLPPTLTGGTEGCLQSRQIKLVWFCFCMHSFVLLLAVIYLVYINNVYVNLVVENYDLDSITNVLSISINITVAFVQFVMQLVVFVKQKSYKQLIHRIAQLERDLLLYYGEYEWLQNDINLSLNFRQRCVQFRQYILWRYGLFMLAFISFVSYINYHLVAEMMDFKDQLLTIYLTSALQVKALEFCLFARIVDEFITALHNFLKCLKYEIAKTDGKCYMSLLFHRKLMTNQFLINRIWLLVRHIEENFAVPMLVLFLYNGIAITHTINWSYVISFDYSTPDYFLKCGYLKPQRNYAKRREREGSFKFVQTVWFVYACG